ncbi:MAG: MG2 domain-containing protein, partial [Pseudomonadota bacterium]
MPDQLTLKPAYIRCAVTIVAAAALSMTGAPRSAGEEAKRGTSAKASKVQPFVHDDSRAAAASYAKWLKGAWTPNGMSARNHIRAGNQILAAGDDPDVAARRFARAVVTDTNSSEAWRGLARALLAKPPASLRGNQRYATPRNAAGAAHRAYDLAKTDKQKALALATLAEALKRRSYWRPALDALKTSLALTPSPAVAARYARMREQHGFRIVNYDVEVERAAPRLCIRFSEDLRSGAPNASVAARFDYTSFVALDGKDPQSLSIEGARLCVNGLIHGETHTVRAREGLPARIDDALAKTVDLRIFVKDRAPSVRASAKRFVLPMNGQNGIPLTTINTSQLDIEIYRIGDRGILRALNDGTVGRNLQQWDRETLTRERGRKVYEGSLSTRSKRNAEVTTAVPVREAIPDFKPGIYAMHAKPSGTETTNGNGATQWFVVSDLGLTAIKAKEGVHVFVKSLTTARNVGAAKIKLVSRSNEVLGTGTSDADGRYSFAAGLTRGEGGMAPALVTVEHADGGFAFLNLTEAAFDLTDRGVKGRNAPGPIDAFMYTDRGVYRAGETVHLSALVRSASGRASKLPTTLVVTRPDGVVFKRTALANQSAGGRTIALLIPKDAMRGTWRMKLHIDPKQPAIANASVLVEDFLPERLALSLATPDADRVEPGKPTRISIEGRYLYGPAAADLAIEGDTIVGPASDGDPDHEGFHFGDTERRITPVRTGLGPNLRTSADGTASVAAKL